jgi:hypothetical protein
MGKVTWQMAVATRRNPWCRGSGPAPQLAGCGLSLGARSCASLLFCTVVTSTGNAAILNRSV